MRLTIQDEFTNLPISRQRKYQLRMARDGRCTECGAKAIIGSRCVEHLIKARERQRKKRNLKTRYHNTLSYRLQTDPEGLLREMRKLQTALKSPKKTPNAPDEFTNLPISRQRKYQLRMKRAGRCQMCGAEAIHSSLCREHLVRARERLRKKLGCRGRRNNSLSYRIEKDADAVRRDVRAAGGAKAKLLIIPSR